MDPLVGGALIGAGGNIIGNLFNASATGRANDANVAAVERQIQFQDLARKTAHQTEVNDLVAAGLNPVLSAGGNGAPMALGAAATVQAPQIQLPDMFAYGLSLKQMELAEKKLNMEGSLVASQINKNVTSKELDELKKKLMGKGMVRSELEGEAAEIIRKALRYMRKNFSTPSLQDLKDKAISPFVEPEGTWEEPEWRAR